MRKQLKSDSKSLNGQAGKHIRKAFAKHSNSEKNPLDKIFIELAQTLMLRELNGDDFQKFKIAMEELPQKFPENMGQEIIFQPAQSENEEDLHIASFGYFGLSSGVKNFALGT